IIKRPRGNGLLIGIPGSGKQSLARLAAFVARCAIFEITLSRGYSEVELKEDIKKLFNLVGVENKETVFLFTESHIANEGFLEVINNLLTTGTVPALYTDDEKEQIINQVRDEVKKGRINNTKE